MSKLASRVNRALWVVDCLWTSTGQGVEKHRVNRASPMYPTTEVHEVGRTHDLTRGQIVRDINTLRDAGLVQTEKRPGGLTQAFAYTQYIGLTPDGMQAIDRRGR